jgi:carotenoid 1,2-hydratase
MTERGRGSLRRDAANLEIGPSALHWDGNRLTVEIDEVTAPLPSRIRGRVRLHPAALVRHCSNVDPAGQHHWRPIAPCARVEVEMEAPALRWSGNGYFDSNAGVTPLAQAVRRWHWSRAAVRGGTAVLYDIARRDAGAASLALHFSTAGAVEPFTPPPRVELPRSSWRLARATGADGGAARLLRTLEDAPFYARSILAGRLCDQPVTAMHESLDMDRFVQPAVQAMLPFRMPRRAG